jgi:hypothetical protein
MGINQEFPVPLWEKFIAFVDISENIQSDFLSNLNYFCHIIYLGKKSLSNGKYSFECEKYSVIIGKYSWFDGKNSLLVGKYSLLFGNNSLIVFCFTEYEIKQEHPLPLWELFMI